MRPRLLALSAVFLLAGAALSGCASLDAGPKTTQQRTITDVDSVELETGGSLRVTLGEAPSLTITAGEKVIDLLTADVEAGVLRLATEREPLSYAGEIRYDLTVTSLTSLTVRGSGDAEADFTGAADPTIVVKGSGSIDASGIDAQTLDLTVDGSGSITVADAVTADLTVRVDGSGGVSIGGSASDQDIELRGSGDYDAPDLESTDARIVLQGSAMADMQVSGTLDAVIDGSGEIAYSGDPHVTKKISGSGDLIPR